MSGESFLASWSSLTHFGQFHYFFSFLLKNTDFIPKSSIENDFLKKFKKETFLVHAIFKSISMYLIFNFP